jgi:hypothetical protein
MNLFPYYEETQRDLKRILTYECRCTARLKVEAEGCFIRWVERGVCHVFFRLNFFVDTFVFLIKL